MALSLPAKLLALSLLIWVLSLTCEGAIPKCCVATSKAMSPSLLRRMERIEVQSSAGVCNINALIVHVKGKKYCVHVAARNILNRVLKRRRGKRRRKLLRGHLKEHGARPPDVEATQHARVPKPAPPRSLLCTWTHDDYPLHSAWHRFHQLMQHLVFHFIPALSQRSPKIVC